MNARLGDLAGLIVLGSALLFFLWVGATKRRLERRRQRVEAPFK